MSATRCLSSFVLLAGLLAAPFAHAEPGPAPARGAPLLEMGDMPPPFMPGLRGVRLSEEQEDKVFLLHHAAQPALREQFKAARKAHEALQDLIASPEFSAGKALALAQAESRAHAEIALLQAKAEFEALALLKPEQRKQFASAPPCPEPMPGAVADELPARPGWKAEPR